MQDSPRYAVGIDIGTTTVRCVVGHLDPATGTPTIVGVGTAPNTGMRKGGIANLNGPAQAIDTALGEAERMSGYEVNAATVSVNGAHILSTKADGMIAVGTADHEVNEDDLARLEEVATVGKVPANREILDVVPYSYRLDGQDGIKDPLGMTGTRLEISANVISALAPHVTNLQKTTELAKVEPHTITPAVVAAARAVLGEQQLESGVAVIDLGGATTSVAVFEEGDVQFMSVIPVGGINITNDLAIGLKTDPEIAEKVKLAHGSALVRTASETVTVKHNKEHLSFETQDIDDIIDARLEELFGAIHKELKRAGYAGKLLSGVVLTGGTAQLKGIVDYAKEALGLAARLGAAKGFGGVAEKLDTPGYATAVGLMLIDASEPTAHTGGRHPAKHAGDAARQAGGMLSRIFHRFKA